MSWDSWDTLLARRLNAIGDLVRDCASADELLRRTGGGLNGGKPDP